jgi:glycosyltransferase involved in cell wall biosynthesis
VIFWSYTPVGRRLRDLGLTERRVQLWGDVNPVGFGTLVRLLRRARPDVLLLTKQREYWMGGVAARLAGRPAVVLRLGLNRPIKDDLKRRAIFGRLSDLVIVNSRVVRDALLETPWLDAGKVRVLYNGVTADPVADGVGRRLLEGLDIPARARVVAGAGRLTRQKGLDVLIRSFARVRGEVPEAHLVVLGSGGRRQELEEEAGRSGAASAIHLVGHRDDVRSILSGVDVFALSSRNEGMANTLLEAMSVGAPIVATDVSGTTEAVRDGLDALVVEPDDPEALAAAIVKLLGDRALASALGNSARVRARELFGMPRMIDDLEDLLREALERCGEASEGGDDWRR